ncbi:unnamed protein product, partial [Wuchereria bancrofti]
SRDLTFDDCRLPPSRNWDSSPGVNLVDRERHRSAEGLAEGVLELAVGGGVVAGELGVEDAAHLVAGDLHGGRATSLVVADRHGAEEPHRGALATESGLAAGAERGAAPGRGVLPPAVVALQLLGGAGAGPGREPPGLQPALHGALADAERVGRGPGVRGAAAGHAVEVGDHLAGGRSPVGDLADRGPQLPETPRVSGSRAVTSLPRRVDVAPAGPACLGCPGRPVGLEGVDGLGVAPAPDPLGEVLRTPRLQVAGSDRLPGARAGAELRGVTRPRADRVGVVRGVEDRVTVDRQRRGTGDLQGLRDGVQDAGPARGDHVVAPVGPPQVEVGPVVALGELAHGRGVEQLDRREHRAGVLRLQRSLLSRPLEVTATAAGVAGDQGAQGTAGLHEGLPGPLEVASRHVPRPGLPDR